jgi:LPXTG-site transpeptidase (sortase) family protein
VKRLLTLLLACTLLAVSVSARTLTAAGQAAEARSPAYCPWAWHPGISGPTPKWIGWIEIPRIGLRVPFSRGTDAMLHGGTDNNLNHGPAVYPASQTYGSLPDQGDTVGMAAHRTTRTHPFCRLDLMEPGYLVILEVKGIEYTYRTEFVDHHADPNSWVYFEHPERFVSSKAIPGVPKKYLTLGACTPPRSESERINLVAKLVAIKRL